MKKIDWARLRANIPNRIQTKAKVHFDVLWQDVLTDKGGNRLHGLTNFDPRQIVIDTQQSDKETVLTAWHEALHAFSDSYEAGLTETEVRKLEKAFPYLRMFFKALEGTE